MPKTKFGGWTCGVRAWLEHNGEVVLGRGRVDLLEAIDRLHSIRQAALSMEMSYRRAWRHVQYMNAAAGEPLVEVAQGGRTGGGAWLTDFGKRAIRQFNDLEKALQNESQRVLAKSRAARRA